MKVTFKYDEKRIKFSELKPGDTFIDPNYPNGRSVEMKVEYGDIDCEFSETGETAEGFASVSLGTGNVFFYTEDFYVIPIKLNAVEI